MASIRTLSSAFFASPVLVLLGQACTENIINEGDVHYHDSPGGMGGAPGPGPNTGGASAGGTGGTGGTTDRYTSHLPECDSLVPLEDLDIDLFGEDGHLFYFEVTPEARVAADEQYCDGGVGGPIFLDVNPGWGRGVYDLGGSDEELCPPSALNVRVVPAGSNVCSDTGKVELDLPGQSSFRPWAEIPNFKLDVGEFIDQKFDSGDKTLRMNNGQADSTIVREATALAIWRAMGYPAPPTRFVRTQSNVWDTEEEPGVFAAHVMVKPYKKAFFSEHYPEVTNAWEGAGDPFAGFGFDSELECEWSQEDDCENELLEDIIDVVEAAPEGAGFMAATEDVIDWPMLHRNQCLSALTGTGDDWIHNTNNVVIAIREDGKMVYLPYSTDISGGHPWYPETAYDGYATLAVRCAEDAECREAALTTCEEMVTDFEELDVPTSIVGERCEALRATELERPADADVCESLAEFYGARPAELRSELEALRQDDGGMGGAGGASALPL